MPNVMPRWTVAATAFHLLHLMHLLYLLPR